MYESPINRFTSEIQSQQEPDFILQLIQTVGYSIDKDELIKALRYDRQQYEKGYMDGIDSFSKEVAPELGALEAERDALRAELKLILKKASTCLGGARCASCPHFDNECGGCPTHISPTEARKRLEELERD